MRLAALAFTLTVLAVVPTLAQTPPPEEHPYGLDPYRPSDVWFLRNFGGVLVANTPLAELRKLDPYKPSHAALLRQLGGGLPLWGLMWHPPPPNPAPLSPFPTAAAPAVGPLGGDVVVIVVRPDDRPAPRSPHTDGVRRPSPVPQPGPAQPTPRRLEAGATVPRSFAEGFDLAAVLREIHVKAEIANVEGQ